MQAHKKPHHARNVAGLSYRPSNAVQNSNTLLTAAAVFLFAALGAAFGHAIYGMSADLSAGPELHQGGRAYGE